MRLLNNKLSTDKVAERFIKSARQMNLTKNRNWLKRLITKRQIGFINTAGVNRILLEEQEGYFMETLFEMISAFERKFDNNWDIDIEYNRIRNTFKINFLIHYDKITIENSESRSREITDLIVVLPIGYNQDTNIAYVKKISGTRVTFEHDEWSSNYMHSHLQSMTRPTCVDEVFQVNDFCIGSEDLSEIEIELSVDFDSEKFELMLYTIDSLVAWESIEGVPYRYMSSITIQSDEQRINPSNSDIKYYYESLENILVEQVHLPFDFVYTQNRYQIKNNDKFNDYIKNIYLTDLQGYATNLLCKKGTDGYFYTHTAITQASIATPAQAISRIKEEMGGELPFIYIQGKQIQFNINYSESINPIDINEYIVYPKFLSYVSEQLESQIYKACVRGSSINKLHNSRSDVRRNSEENQILM